MCRIKHSINIYRSSTIIYDGIKDLGTYPLGIRVEYCIPLRDHRKTKERNHTVSFLEAENQNKPFSFNFGGGNFHSQILGFPTLPQSTPKPDRRKKVARREKLNVTSLCLHNKKSWDKFDGFDQWI